MQKSVTVKVRCNQCGVVMPVKFGYAELKDYLLEPSADARADIKQRLITGDGKVCTATGGPHFCHVVFLQDIYFIIKIVFLLGMDRIADKIRKFNTRSA